MCFVPLDFVNQYTYLVPRVGQSRIYKYAPCMTVYLVISLPEMPYVHRIYMVLANPTSTQVTQLARWREF